MKPDFSLIEPRERLDATPRKGFTKKQRAEAFLRAEGRCQVCGCKLASTFDIDHVLALDHGGLHKPANWRVLCKPCHLDKTRDDVKASAKINRLERKHGFEGDKRKPRKVIPSRPFQKSERKIASRKFGQ